MSFPIGALVLLVVYAAGIAVSVDFSHYTWWGIVVACIHELSILAEWFFIARAPRLAVIRSNSWLFVACVHGTIAGSVVIMSGMKCHMLVEAVDKHGEIMYVAGNLALHYMPLIRAIYCTPPTILNVYKQCTTSAALSITYAIVENPKHIYGCYTSVRMIVFAFILISCVQIYVVSASPFDILHNMVKTRT